MVLPGIWPQEMKQAWARAKGKESATSPGTVGRDTRTRCVRARGTIEAPMVARRSTGVALHRHGPRHALPLGPAVGPGLPSNNPVVRRRHRFGQGRSGCLSNLRIHGAGPRQQPVACAVDGARRQLESPTSDKAAQHRPRADVVSGGRGRFVVVTGARAQVSDERTRSRWRTRCIVVVNDNGTPT